MAAAWSTVRPAKVSGAFCSARQHARLRYTLVEQSDFITPQNPSDCTRRNTLTISRSSCWHILHGAIHAFIPPSLRDISKPLRPHDYTSPYSYHRSMPFRLPHAGMPKHWHDASMALPSQARHMEVSGNKYHFNKSTNKRRGTLCAKSTKIFCRIHEF